MLSTGASLHTKGYQGQGCCCTFAAYEGCVFHVNCTCVRVLLCRSQRAIYMLNATICSQAWTQCSCLASGCVITARWCRWRLLLVVRFMGCWE